MDDFDDDDWMESAEAEAMMAAAESGEAYEPPPPPPVKPVDGALVRKTLLDVWGYDAFREGQEAAVTAVLGGRDCAVYWATGSGKSLVYQLPALTRGSGVVLVVSPLVSLMMDQVKALNTMTGRDVACFLGSSQTDRSVEGRALGGGYRLVYATPEKAVNQRLADALVPAGLTLIAIDEAHCVSEWGHDFRPAYRHLDGLRDGAARDVPLVALTATAAPRVRADIERTLKLKRGFHVAAKTFDRPNLRLGCRRRGDEGLAKALAFVAKDLASASAKAAGSTIVYCATRGEVEAAAQCLAALAPAANVAAYHAGLPDAARRDAHYGFLSGKVSCVVATVAFGMGIDKPDIRRVVHLSPPKSMEEYYQQVGRAGRDGLSADCTLLFKDNQFANYNSDFYTGKLSGDGLSNYTASLDAIRAFAGLSSGCRRRSILEHFRERPPTADWRCGTCDLCGRAASGTCAERDFTAVARLLLAASEKAVDATGTDLVELATGTFRGKGASKFVPDSYARAQVAVSALPRDRKTATKVFLKQLIPDLVAKGHLFRTTKKGEYAAFDVYRCSDLGAAVARGHGRVMLPTPQYLLDQEEAAKRKSAARTEELRANGVDVDAIPEEELAAGKGPVLTAELDWLRRLEGWRKTGQDARAARYEALLAAILEWRSSAADAHSVAPARVLPDHLAKKCAYALPTTAAALTELGVRFGAGAKDLAALIDGKARDLGISAPAPAAAGLAAAPLPLPESFAPARWVFAIDKPNKNGKPKPWEVSYDRFEGGASCAAIAATQASGKAIQAATVVGHLLSALTRGRAVDLRRLDRDGKAARPQPCGCVSRDRWDAFEDAAARSGADVVGAESYEYAALCDALGGDIAAAAATDYKERSPEQVALTSALSNDRRWWEALKRAGYAPPDEGAAPPAKKPKL